MEKRPVYLFAHIPKTGGQTVRGHLRRQLGRARIISANTGEDEHADRIELLPEDERERCDLVMGHGVNSALASCFPGRPARFFTVLRDPVAHVISNYNWDAHRLEQSQGGARPSFDEWYRHGVQHSLISRWLITRFRGRPLRDSLRMTQHQLLQEASAVLKGFWLVAPLEELEAGLRPLFQALELPQAAIEPRNVAGRDYKRYITRTPEIEEQIRRRSIADMRLYRRFCSGARSPAALKA